MSKDDVSKEAEHFRNARSGDSRVDRESPKKRPLNAGLRVEAAVWDAAWASARPGAAVAVAVAVALAVAVAVAVASHFRLRLLSLSLSQSRLLAVAVRSRLAWGLPADR